MVIDGWIYVDGGEVNLANGQQSVPGEDNHSGPCIQQNADTLMIPVNDTFAINLSEDWTNSTLKLTHTQRTSKVPPGWNFESLWWDKKRNVIYQFGGEKPYIYQRASAPNPEESIWGLTPDGNGSGSWAEYVGSTANATWPQGILRPSHGFSGSNDTSGYFFGGVAGSHTDAQYTGPTISVPGLLTFDYDSYVFNNMSTVPDSEYTVAMEVSGSLDDAPFLNGQMLSVSNFGTEGLLVALPNPGEGGAFNNITIFDIASQQWLWQSAVGNGNDDIPSVRNDFCAVWVQGNNSDTSEM